jgi:hypothetical protein
MTFTINGRKYEAGSPQEATFMHVWQIFEDLPEEVDVLLPNGQSVRCPTRWQEFLKNIEKLACNNPNA